MYSIRHVDQIGCKNKSRIYRATPWRMVCFRGRNVATLHTAGVYLRHFATRCSGVDLNCIGNLVAIHWLREMNFK